MNLSLAELFQALADQQKPADVPLSNYPRNFGIHMLKARPETPLVDALLRDIEGRNALGISRAVRPGLTEER